MTKVAVLDTSLQRTHEWLHEISEALGFDNERAAYAALRATLHVVRDRLPVELVAHLGAVTRCVASFRRTTNCRTSSASRVQC